MGTHNSAGSITATCTPSSGSFFPIGTTHVGCDASDGSNVAHAGFDVVVSDVGLPTITVDAPPPVEATSGSGANVGYTKFVGRNASDASGFQAGVSVGFHF